MRKVQLQPLLMPSLFPLSTSQSLVCIISCFHDLCLFSLLPWIYFSLSCSSEPLCILHIPAQPGYFLRLLLISPLPTHTCTHTHTQWSSWMKSGHVTWPPGSPSKSESLFCVLSNIWFLKEFSAVSKPGWIIKMMRRSLLFVFWSSTVLAKGDLVPQLNWTHALCSEAQSLNPDQLGSPEKNLLEVDMPSSPMGNLTGQDRNVKLERGSLDWWWCSAFGGITWHRWAWSPQLVLRAAHPANLGECQVLKARGWCGQPNAVGQQSAKGEGSVETGTTPPETEGMKRAFNIYFPLMSLLLLLFYNLNNHFFSNFF